MKCLTKTRIRGMDKGPKLPHRLKWGGRTAARAGEVEYPIGVRVVGHTGLKGVAIAGVRESVADGVGAWGVPGGPKGAGGSGVFMRKPRAGAYRRYITLKGIVHGES